MFPQDSLAQDTLVSVLFKSNIENERLNTYQYRHTQGFFCDFEDRINKNRKMQLNLGVGDQ